MLICRDLLRAHNTGSTALSQLLPALVLQHLMSDDIAIKIEGLWKRYGLPVPESCSEPGTSCVTKRGQTLRPGRLTDLNLEVRVRDTRNSRAQWAGKKHAPQASGGVTAPSRAELRFRGRIFPMIELNAGLNRELTAERTSACLPRSWE